jgi:hypothetical protein
VELGVELGGALPDNILELLAMRFGTVSDRVVTALAEVEDLTRLKALLRKTVTVNLLTEFEMTLTQSVVNDP